MSASVCSQLCVRSSLNAQLGYTQLKDYINTHERKGKRRCTAVQLSDWPKGFTLNASPGDNDCREAQGDGERERQRESERMRRCREKERAMSDAHGLPLPPPSQREDSDVPCPPHLFAFTVLEDFLLQQTSLQCWSSFSSQPRSHRSRISADRQRLLGCSKSLVSP